MEWGKAQRGRTPRGGRERSLPRAASDSEHDITGIAFKRTKPEESRVYFNGDLVGEVHRQGGILNPGSHFYVAHLDEDPRGPVRNHGRARIRETVGRRILTHPAWP